MDYIDINKKISARMACTGLSYQTLKNDIEKDRLKAIKTEKGHYQIRVIDLIDYADYLHHSNRNILVCPMGVIKHRVRYAVFGIYD